MYYIITFAGACQLTRWLFALVDIIEKRAGEAAGHEL